MAACDRCLTTRGRMMDPTDSGDDDHGHDEALSALMDGELRAAERERLIRRLLAEPGLRARWARYHVLRAAANGSPPGILDSGFCERLHDTLAGEPAPDAPRRQRPPGPRWLRPVAGATVAAGVALVAFLGLLAWQPQSPDGTGVNAPAAGEPTAAAPRIDGGAATAAVRPAMLATAADPAERAALRRHLEIYLASHSGYARAADMPGVLPYTRFAGFNAGQ